MKKLFLLAFAAFAFATCSDDSYYYELPDRHTIDFEGAVLGDDGYIWGKPQAVTLTEDDAAANYFGEGSKYFFAPIYTQGDAFIYSFYCDYRGLYGSAYDSWNGFVISNQVDKTIEGYTNDKSVYADGGAGGSAQFAIAYYGAWTGDPYGTPTIKFNGAVKAETIAIANTTYLYLYFKGSNPASAVDVKAVIKGFNSGIQTGSVEVKLVDAASGVVKSGWETVDISSLGMVTSMTFAVATTDSICPLYFAIDNLVYTK